ncbi:MAG: 30S ribosomal protein S9 [Gammaproteobacteria bacterium]
MNAKLYYHSIGSDKQAVARVFMFKGTGVFKINNDRNLESYFPRETFRMVVMIPLNVVNMDNNFDFKITVSGGGNSGQADAIKLAIARSLIKYDEELKKPLRIAGCVTRDKRKVERKKYGLRKARKKEQYSKR